MAIRSVEYLQSLVRELAKLPDETEWIEFKCNNKQPQMIGEYISALSNSAALCERPKAYLVWGVDDATHKIVGTEFQYRKMKKGNEELEAWLSRMLSPRINFRFFEVPMDEGMVVLMEIPCAEKQPVQFAGGEFIRIGTNKKNLKEYPDKERELWRTFDSTPYELRIAMGNLDEDEMVLLLDYSKYYDKLEMPIPRNRDKVLEDLQHEKFIKRNDAGAQQALDDLNASLGYNGNDKVYMTFEGPENESDTNSQINIIDSVISENPDALILGIIDQQSGQAQMEGASDSQIPVVIADSGIESDLITSTCATDHAAAAKLAADHLCEAIGNSGEVAIVAHQYNTESSVERVEAFKKEIEEKYTDVKVVQVNYGDGEESIADMLKNTLETYPALKGIFCTNEDMADQTLDALADMENTEQIQIVGFDSGEKQQKAIQEGREYGTVTQNPYGLGYAAIVAAVRAIQGLPVDQKIDTGYQWLDKDTIDLETNQKYLYN